jgi:hypothetical protein
VRGNCGGIVFLLKRFSAEKIAGRFVLLNETVHFARPGRVEASAAGNGSNFQVRKEFEGKEE